MKNRKLLLAAVYTLSFVAILWYPAEKIIRFEYPSAEPTLIKFHVGVYDPYDPMRGRYVRLDIEPSRITETGKKIPIRSRLRGSKGYIVFEKGKDGFVRLLRLEKEKPAVKIEAPPERKVEPAPEIVPQVAEPTVTETVAEEPTVEQLVVPVEEVDEAPTEETPAAPIAEVVETAPVEEAPAEFSPAPSVETSVPTENVTEIREDEESGLPYNKNMSVEEICTLMTEDEARNYVVPVGTCKNWTMDQVASRRPISLKYYLSPAYNGDDNILRAAATILLNIINSNAA